MRRKKVLDKSFFLVLVILLIAAGTIVFLYFQFKTDRISSIVNKKETVKVLLLFHEGDKHLFSELFMHHPETHKSAFIDVPGETGAIIESLGRVDRLDRLLGEGDQEAFLKEVSKLLGAEIDFYLDFDLQALVVLCDLIDGVEVFIADSVEMIEEDNKALFPSGNVVLDGEKLKSYLLYEDTNALESEIVEKRQKIIFSLLDKIGMSAPVLGRADLYPLYSRYFESNLDKRDLKAFFHQLLYLQAEKTVYQRILGLRRNVDEETVLLFPHYDGGLLREAVKQVESTLKSDEVLAEKGLFLTLEILNGTPKNGLAARTARIFQSFGYDVAVIDNAERDDVQQTRVIDRTGTIEYAKKVAEHIKCEKISSEVPPAGAGEIDISIILGKDFDGRYCQQKK